MVEGHRTNFNCPGWLGVQRRGQPKEFHHVPVWHDCSTNDVVVVTVTAQLTGEMEGNADYSIECISDG